MVLYARWQATITDDEGNILPGASVEVRSDTVGAPLAVLYSDRNGLTPIGNPFQADAEGFAGFHVVGGAYKITVTSGSFSRVWRYVGIGLSGETDALVTGVSWEFQASTTDADPGVGGIKFNNATLASVTTLYIDNSTPDGADVSAWLDTFDNSNTTLDRGVIIVQSIDARAIFIGRVTGSVVDGTGYRKVSVTHISSSGTFEPGVSVFITFAPAATNGIDGITPGIPFTFDSSTSMADPGTGDFRLNNATLASVTAAAFDDLSAATGNPDVSALVLSWDDSTTSTNRGYLLIKKASAPQNFAMYRISGTSTDNAGWTQLALTHVASAGSFTAADVCVVEFSPSGATSAGKQTIWVPAAAMFANGAAPPLNTIAIAGSNVVLIQTRDCDATVEEYLYFSVAMPKSWDEGTLSFEILWSHAATVTNFGVVFTLYANAFSNDDTLSQNAGSPGQVTDTGGTTDDLYISPESSAITVAGSPGEMDIVLFRLNRVPANGSDTLAVDARVHGVRLFYTTNAVNDA